MKKILLFISLALIGAVGGSIALSESASAYVPENGSFYGNFADLDDSNNAAKRNLVCSQIDNLPWDSTYPPRYQTGWMMAEFPRSEVAINADLVVTFELTNGNIGLQDKPVAFISPSGWAGGSSTINCGNLSANGHFNGLWTTESSGSAQYYATFDTVQTPDKITYTITIPSAELVRMEAEFLNGTSNNSMLGACYENTCPYWGIQLRNNRISNGFNQPFFQGYSASPALSVNVTAEGGDPEEPGGGGIEDFCELNPDAGICKDYSDIIGGIDKGAQDRYDREKQEEADREREANDQANDIVGGFSFSFLNPLGAFFAYSDGCQAIPTLAAWLHLNQSTVCPVFPAYIRNALTPVVAIFANLILFGFAVRWLKKGDTL